MKQDLKVLAEHLEKKVGKAHVFHKMWDVLKREGEAFPPDFGQVGAARRIPELG